MWAGQLFEPLCQPQTRHKTCQSLSAKGTGSILRSIREIDQEFPNKGGADVQKLVEANFTEKNELEKPAWGLCMDWSEHQVAI